MSKLNLKSVFFFAKNKTARNIVIRVAFLVLLVGTLSFGATTAFFNDTETSSGNTFVAGAIDLRISNESYYNGVLNTGTSWLSKDLGSNDLFYNFDDVKPGDYGENTIDITVLDNNAWLCADVTLTSNNDNTCLESELGDDPTCTNPGLNTGDLAQEIQMLWWKDDGDNVLEENETIIKETTLASSGALALADSNFSILGSGPLEGSETYYIGNAWCHGAITLQPVAPGDNDPTIDPGFRCDGGGLTNASQTDIAAANVSFQAVQSRNNASFVCEAGPFFGPDSIVAPTSVSIFTFDDGTVVEAATDQLVLVLEENISPQDLQAILDAIEDSGSSINGKISALHTLQIGTPSKEIAIELLESLQLLEGVVSVNLNGSVEAQTNPSPNDIACDTGRSDIKVPLADCDYWIDAINLRSAWDVTTGSSAIKIGVVDTGIDKEGGHFPGKSITIVPTSFSGNDDANLGHEAGHGTFVASLAAARGNDGVLGAGVAWESPLVIADAADAFSFFGIKFKSFQLDLSFAIAKTIDAGAKVVNVSWGASTGDIPLEDSTNKSFLKAQRLVRYWLSPALVHAQNNGALVVLAANNDGNGLGRGFRVMNDDVYMPLPGDLPGGRNLREAVRTRFNAAWDTNALIVAATEPLVIIDPISASDQIPTLFTRQGDVVDIAAPGRDVGGALANSFGILYADSGTSFASPIVAGAAALVWAVHPTFSPQEVKQKLKDTATPIAGSIEGVVNNVGAGLLNVGKAVGADENGTVSGTVTVAGTDITLADVILNFRRVPTLEVIGAGETISDAGGHYSKVLPPGEYMIEAIVNDFPAVIFEGNLHVTVHANTETIHGVPIIVGIIEVP